MHHVSPRLSGTPGAIRSPAPSLRQHTPDILARLGLDGDAIQLAEPRP